jgi:divalent metal cation (Fe/Co/Zn/Cd) transporter
MSQKHNHPEDAPNQFAQYGNLGFGIVGFMVGVATKSEALLADSAHNIGDYFGHREHLATTEAERHELGSDSVVRSRRRAGRIIASLALGTALYSGIQLQQQIVHHETPKVNVAAAIAGLGSIGLNASVKYKFSKHPLTLQGQKHSDRHNNVDLACSIAALSGILLNSKYPGIEAVAGLGVSTATGWLAYSVYNGKDH